MASSQKSKPSYVYAIIGVSLVLFLLGTLGWLVLNGQSLTKAFKEDIEVQVILHDNTRPAMAQKLQDILDKQPFIRSTTYISKEEAAEGFKKEWGEDFTELLDFNPLYASINLRLYEEYVNPDSLRRIDSFVRQSNIVREVSYPTAVIDTMNKNFKKIGWILGGISLLLFIIVVVLIDNTVRLAMFSNRFLIKTMQMVGATRWFIAKPFDQRAVVNGLISGVIACAGVYVVKSIAESWLPELKFYTDTTLMVVLFVSIICIGIIISFLSTHRSVIKYLKVRLDDLY